MKKSSLIAIILIVLLAFIGVFFFLKHHTATNKNINSTTETTQEKNSKIINLNEKNFESTIKKTKEPLLVCFSASWCSYCQKEKPILKKLANEKNSKALTYWRPLYLPQPRSYPQEKLTVPRNIFV